MTLLASDQFALLKISETVELSGAATIDNNAIAKIKNAAGTTSRLAKTELGVTR